MYLAGLLYAIVFLANTNLINASVSFLPESTETTSTTVFPSSSTPPSTETQTISTIDLLQNQLHAILVQFCASEIDRNKTASAILKFRQLADPETSTKDVVQFYIENYDESFDNLFAFINHMSSTELQKIAYNTLVEAMNSNQINVINLLSFENFIRTKYEITSITEREIYEDLLLAIGNHIKVSIIGTDLNSLITFINNSTNPDRIFELIPTIVQSIDLKNFTDMNRIFEFSMQLPKANQLKLISKVLSEMREKGQYQHIFHVICQINLLRNSISDPSMAWTSTDICSLSALEKEIPTELWQLIGNIHLWQIENTKGFLSYSESPKYEKKILIVDFGEPGYWGFETVSYNSISIRKKNEGYYSDNLFYMTVEYCFHNDSFPTASSRDYNDLTQTSWYLSFSRGFRYFQITNIHTNELLIADNQTLVNNQTRVRLSENCSDCYAYQWELQALTTDLQNIYSPYSCPDNYHEGY